MHNGNSKTCNKEVGMCNCKGKTTFVFPLSNKEIHLSNYEVIKKSCTQTEANRVSGVLILIILYYLLLFRPLGGSVIKPSRGVEASSEP